MDLKLPKIIKKYYLLRIDFHFVKLTLWGDDIKAVNVGDTIVITNGYTNSFKDEVSLTKGKFGKMEVNPQ